MLIEIIDTGRSVMVNEMHLLFDVNFSMLQPIFENSFHCSELSVNPSSILIITYQDVVLYDVSRWIF